MGEAGETVVKVKVKVKDSRRESVSAPARTMA